MTTRFLPTHWRDYALLDAGHGKRLERFGEVTVVRPDPFALWPPQEIPGRGSKPTPPSSRPAAPMENGAPLLERPSGGRFGTGRRPWIWPLSWR